jgi:hypothetical protein
MTEEANAVETAVHEYSRLRNRLEHSSIGLFLPCG